MVGEQRAIFTGRDEVDADRVLPRIAARSIFDLQLVAVVFLVALYGDRARRHRERFGDAFELVFVGEVFAVGARGEPRRSTVSRNFWCAIIRCSSFSSSGPAISRLVAGMRTMRASTDRLIRNASRSRSSLM